MKNRSLAPVVVLALVIPALALAEERSGAQDRKVPRAIVLPPSCNTPDAMAVLADESIILSVPNFTDPASPGVLMKVTPDDQVTLFCRLPVHPQTGHTYPMGVRQAPSGDLYVADCQFLDETPNNSRLLCVRVKDGRATGVEVVAIGLNVANGVAIRGGYVYVTDSARGNAADGVVLSAVYRFRLDERDVQVQPEGADPHLVATLKTRSQEIPVGADGIDFDDQGVLYVANCGDALLEKISLDAAGQVMEQKNLTGPGDMKSADGIYFDCATRRIYVADILANAIRAVTLDGKVETLAEDGDNDGANGRLDGPSEAVVRGGEVIAANFDRVFPGCINTKSEKPYTLSVVARVGRNGNPVDEPASNQ